MARTKRMHRGTAALLAAIESLGLNLDQAQIAQQLGYCDRGVISKLIKRYGLRYINKKRGRKPRPEKPREVYPTARLFLENIGKPESDIARLAGVSRQRIHQLEKRFMVCHLDPKRRK